MANLLTAFDNGTFESYPPPYNTEPAPAANEIAIGKTNLEAWQGTYSMGIFNGSAVDQSYVETDIYFRKYGTQPMVLTAGKRYIVKGHVKTGGASVFGSDGIFVALAGGVALGGYYGAATMTDSDADTDTYTFGNGVVAKTTKIGKLKDKGWIELTLEFTEPATGPASGRTSIYLVIMREGNVFDTIVIEPGETYTNNGKLFIDGVTFEEVVLCDLALGTPSYTKTDESIFEGDNGSVTLIATSSYTKTYAIDNIAGPYQSSNVFSGLAPGTYDFYIKDTNPNDCAVEVLNVVILPAAAPPPPPPPPPAPTKATIDAKPLNENNFVRWFAIDGYKNFNSIEFINCCWDTPAGYRRQSAGRMNELRFAPIIVTNEKFTFYINFNTPLTDPTFSQMRIALVDHRGLVQDNIATLKRDLFDDGVTYNIYCDEILLSGVVVNRYYRYVIYDVTTDELKFISGEIQLLSTDTAQCDSVRLQYRSTINLRGIRYEALPEFLNMHRIRFYRTDEQDEGVLDQYRAVSSGQLRNVAYELDRYIELESYYFDDQAHRAAGVWQLHDVNIINDKAYIVKTSYKRDKAPTKSFFKGTIQLFEQAFSTQDRFNRLGNITILSDLLLTEDESRVKL